MDGDTVRNVRLPVRFAARFAAQLLTVMVAGSVFGLAAWRAALVAAIANLIPGVVGILNEYARTGRVADATISDVLDGPS